MLSISLSGEVKSQISDASITGIQYDDWDRV